MARKKFSRLQYHDTNMTQGFSFLARWRAVLVLMAISTGVLAGYADSHGSPPLVVQAQPVQSSSQQAQTKKGTDPQVQAVLDKMAAAGVLHPTSVEEAQRAYRFYAQFAGPPEHVFRVQDRKIDGPIGPIPIRIYASRDADRLPVFVFFHGGGFVAGDLNTEDSPLRALTNRCDCLIVSVSYRLAPQFHYPAATEDAYAATMWVADHAAEINADPERIAVGGEGAGGNLAAVVILMARDRHGPHLTYQVLISPILDAMVTTYSWVQSADPTLTTEAMVAKWAVYVPPNADQQHPYVSPMNEKNLQDLPPALLIAGSSDPIRDEVQEYARELSDSGVQVRLVRYPNMIHGFFLMAGELDASKQAIDTVGNSLKQAFYHQE